MIASFYKGWGILKYFFWIRGCFVLCYEQHIPDGHWLCPQCRCRSCRQSKLDENEEAHAALTCAQCEHKCKFFTLIFHPFLGIFWVCICLSTRINPELSLSNLCRPCLVPGEWRFRFIKMFRKLVLWKNLWKGTLTPSPFARKTASEALFYFFLTFYWNKIIYITACVIMVKSYWWDFSYKLVSLLLWNEMGLYFADTRGAFPAIRKASFSGRGQSNMDIGEVYWAWVWWSW